MLETRVRPRVRGAVERIARTVGRAGVTPNGLTLLGLGGTGAAAALVALGLLGAAAAVLIPSALADALDGAVARATGRTSRRGAYLDAISDRIADAAILGTLAWHFRLGAPRAAAVAVCTLALSFLASYTKARASSLGYRCDAGIAGRGDRLVLMIIALVVPGAAEPALWVLAGLLLVTVGQRARAVWKQAEGE